MNSKLLLATFGLVLVAGLSVFAFAHGFDNDSGNTAGDMNSGMMGMMGSGMGMMNHMRSMMDKISDMSDEDREKVFEEMDEMHEMMSKYMRGEISDEEFEAFMEEHHKEMQELMGDSGMMKGCMAMHRNGMMGMMGM